MFNALDNGSAWCVNGLRTGFTDALVKSITRGSVLLASLALSLTASAQHSATRAPGEDVNDPSFRVCQHLTPDAGLLFNGLGLSPAGEHVRISDMPLKMLVA